MRSIRISEYAYNFLKEHSKIERRNLREMLDCLIDVFIDDERLAQRSVPQEAGTEDIQDKKVA